MIRLHSFCCLLHVRCTVAVLLTALLLVAPVQAQPISTAPTPTAAPGTAPDRCEPNDTLVAPCALQTEVDHTDLNVMDGSVDVYAFLLKGQRVYTISATSTTGIDPVLRVFRADQTEQVVAENDDTGPGSPNAAVQVTVETDGLYLVEVTNRAPGEMTGKTYTLAARSSAAPEGTPVPSVQQSVGDLLENNYDVDHAAPLAWGVPYDLSLVCPDQTPNACEAGDHDFLLVPVKQGIPLIALTYDLGPGADTLLTLYKPAASQQSEGAGYLPGWMAVTSNDDSAPGRTLRSQVMLTPDWTGDALLVVAASNRRNPPPMPEALGPGGRYRLIVGSPALDAVQTVLNAQPDLEPAPTPAPTAAPLSVYEQGSTTRASPPALTAPSPTAVPPTATPAPQSVDAPAPGQSGDAEDIIKESCTVGTASVERESADFYAAANPISERRLLTTYPQGTMVTLLGSCYIGWVKVQPQQAVTPGWMFAPDLRLLEGSAPTVETTANPGAPVSPAAPADPVNPRETTQPTATPAPQPVAVTRLPAPVSAPVPAPQRQTVTIMVRVVNADQQPRANVRVVLRNAFGKVLVDVLTPVSGQVVFTPDLLPGSAVYVALPAQGVQVPVDLTRPDVVLTIS